MNSVHCSRTNLTAALGACAPALELSLCAAAEEKTYIEHSSAVRCVSAWKSSQSIGCSSHRLHAAPQFQHTTTLACTAAVRSNYCKIPLRNALTPAHCSNS
eukprot:5168-Heterococcus_DN1.PRE.5